MEEWEKIDVGEVRALEVTLCFLLLLPQRTKLATQDFQHTHHGSRHTVMCVYRTKSSGEGTIDATIMEVPWYSRGRCILEVSRCSGCSASRHVFPAEIFVGGSWFFLMRHHGSTLVPNKGDTSWGFPEKSTIPENAFLSLYSPEAIWSGSQKDLFYRILTVRFYLVTRKTSRHTR